MDQKNINVVKKPNMDQIMKDIQKVEESINKIEKPKNFDDTVDQYAEYLWNGYLIKNQIIQLINELKELNKRKNEQTNQVDKLKIVENENQDLKLQNEKYNSLISQQNSFLIEKENLINDKNKMEIGIYFINTILINIGMEHTELVLIQA